MEAEKRKYPMGAVRELRVVVEQGGLFAGSWAYVEKRDSS